MILIQQQQVPWALSKTLEEKVFQHALMELTLLLRIEENKPQLVDTLTDITVFRALNS